MSLTFHRFDGLRTKLWVLGQMAIARIGLAREPDIGFWRLCGSGTGQGFTPIPNFGVWAILATWPDEETARNRTQNAPVFKRWRAKANDCWTVYLTPSSVRGMWGRREPFFVSNTPESGPLAVLTRATIKPKIALKFWERVPDISTVIGSDPNVAFKIGIGELPLLQQVTFSIWPNAQSMTQFARTPDGPHAQAIKAVKEGRWFKEELYARFRILGDAGSWGGQSPIAHLGDIR